MNATEVGVCRDFEVWRERMEQLFAGVQIADDAPADFHGTWSSWTLGEIGLAEFFVSSPITLARHVSGRTPQAPPVHHLFVQQAGWLRHNQFGRQADSSTRVLSLVDGCSAYAAWQSANFHSLVVSVPSAVLQARYGDLRQACITPLSAHAGGGSVLWHFVVHLWQRRHEITAAEAPALSAALVELLGVLCQPADDAPASPQLRHRTRLLDHIDAHLPDPELNASRIAAALGVSTRHVHKLMEGTGRTLSRYLLERRLEHCRKALGNPLLAHLTITAIALQWGFNDMPHFSRAFRARYGEPPRQWRQRQPALSEP